MDLFKALVLGLVQGLTEFLPVSSSGHLVLAQHLFGLKEPLLFFDIGLHVATVLAVIVFVRRELAGMIRVIGTTPWLDRAGLARAWREEPFLRLLILVVLGCLPTAFIGLVFRHPLTALFNSTRAVGWALLATGCLLLLSRFFLKGRIGYDGLGPGRALVLGAVQGLAIIPGLSRSGVTITSGLFLGLERETAARFSFLLYLPAVGGALILELAKPSGGLPEALPLLLGGAAAALSGYLALVVLVKILVRGRFHYFAPYCWLVGLLTLILAG